MREFKGAGAIDALTHPPQLKLNMMSDKGSDANSRDGLDAPKSDTEKFVVEVAEPTILEHQDYAGAVWHALKCSELPVELKGVLVALGEYVYQTAWYAEECGACTLIKKGSGEIVHPARPQREAVAAAWKHLYEMLELYNVHLEWKDFPEATDVEPQAMVA